jgi:hypothetical protein
MRKGSGSNPGALLSQKQALTVVYSNAQASRKFFKKSYPDGIEQTE